MAIEINNNELLIPALTSSRIQGISATITELLSANNINANTILVTSLTATSARIINFDGRINLSQLFTEKNVVDGQTPVYKSTLNQFIPDFPIAGYTGTRLHDFRLTAWKDTSFTEILTADTSYCGVALSGTGIWENKWRIIRIMYTDGGMLSAQGLTINTAWTARDIANYTVIV